MLVNRTRRPETIGQQDMNGVIVVDKPADITSAGVVQILKKTLTATKVGHAGTLDPFAEGVLVCCINQATRLSGFLLHGKKRYVAVLKLGQETDTQDLTGTVISSVESVSFSTQTIRSAVESFQGPIEQLPPIYSALKHKGVALYKLARRGQPVQKPPRRVHIYDIGIKKIDLPYICFEVFCSAGTYIRTLGADIGQKLGCGGHLVALKRTESSGFKLDQAIAVAELDGSAVNQRLAEKIINMKDALPDWPNHYADKRLAQKIRQGQTLSLNDLRDLNIADRELVKGQYLKIVDQEDDLIAIMAYTESGEQPKYACVFPK